MAMNNETMMLLKRHFNAAFAAPDGIKKLRELILTLAMQGKLVPQDPNDEPASELLKSIELEKQQLVKERKIKTFKLFPDVNLELIPYELPKGWKWVRLGNVGAFERGRSKHRPRNDKRLFIDGSYPFVQTGDVSKSKFTNNEITSCGSYYNDFGLQQSRLWPKGTLCITIAANIAETGFLGMEACIPDSVVVFLSIDESLSKIVKVFIDVAKQDLERYAPSTAQKNINLGIINDLIFPLPPLKEQRRIVAEIDRLMARCDELEKLRADRSQKLLTVHTAALDNLLKAKESSDFSIAWHFITQNFSELYTVKENVAELRKDPMPQIGSLQSILAESSINGVSKGPTSDISATEILRISAGTSQKDFYVNEDDFKYVDLSVNEIEKFKLIPGDLLACRFNGNLHYVGRFSYYRGKSGRVQVNPDKLIRFRINTEAHCPRYVCYMMNASQTRSAIEAMCATTAGNIGLSAGRLKTIEIPLPPLAEQHRIVSEIDRLMALCDRLEESIEAAKGKQTDLLNALMSQV
jgi:type I restriction enzyme, S subunit